MPSLECDELLEALAAREGQYVTVLVASGDGHAPFAAFSGTLGTVEMQAESRADGPPDAGSGVGFVPIEGGPRPAMPPARTGFYVKEPDFIEAAEFGTP